MIELPESLDTVVFYGVNNANMRLLKDMHPSMKIAARGHTVKISGAEEAVLQLLSIVEKLAEYAVKTNTLTEEHVMEVIKGNEIVEPSGHEHLILHGVGGKSIIARTANQQRLVKEYEENDLMFAIGPAGSGKTYTAIALAVKALKNKEVRRIILSRPAVEAGEKLGFLPGDMKEKIDPYLQPLYDALQDMIPMSKLADYMANGTIQIKMFLTRLGFGSKMIVTGDVTQIDLPLSQRSGLIDALHVLDGVKGIAKVEFDRNDIVRHRLVQRIVQAYAQAEKRKE